MSTTDPSTRAPAAAGQTVHQVVRDSQEFADLRHRFRTFIFPLVVLFLTWYFLYVLLAAFAPEFMSTKVFGNINVGLLFGLGQFVSTFAITMAYRRWADRKFDSAAEALREHVEEGTIR